jgi:UDP-glucose 4-epimerase
VDKSAPGGDGVRVLVTGGAGFFGSHVVDLLCAEGDEVLVVDDLSTGDRTNVPDGVRLVVGDVSDREQMRELLGGEQLDAVVHCAAKTKVVESIERPDLYHDVIVNGTSNVLDIAQMSGAGIFVNSNTGGALYGETPVCATEDAPIDPPSPYGRYKAEAERLALSTPGLRTTSFRFANIYGPRQRRDLEGGVIAIFIGCWRTGTPLTVFGDGTAQRDYVYVADCASAVRDALRRDIRGTYNIGTGVATSVNDLIAALSRLLGPPPGSVQAAERPGELQRSCLDASKAARDGVWRPATALADGLRRTTAG